MITKNDATNIKMIETFDALKEALQKKASLLLTHENKPYAFIGLPYNNCSIDLINGKTICTISTNWFLDIVYNEILANASQTYKENFGIGKPLSVIEAIYKVAYKVTEVDVSQVAEFAKLLSKENFCFVAEIKEGKVVGDILRVDLFRGIKDTAFEGGLFHAYRHFSYNGTPLSTLSKGYEIAHPRYLKRIVIESFFNQKLNEKEKDNYEAEFSLNKRKSIKVGYYKESKCSSVYFVNTAHVFSK